MIDRRAVFSSLILPLGLAGCSWASATARLKLTLSVIVDGAVHEGSTVFDSTYRRIHYWGSSADDAGGSKVGDAVMVNLPPAGALFGVWTNVTFNDGHNFMGAVDVLSILPPKPAPRSDPTDVSMMYELQKVRVPRPLPRIHWPVLVYLPVFADLKSARPVLLDEIENIFGPGSSIAVTLQGTDSPVSRGMEKRLPWWHELENPEPKSPVAQRPFYQWLRPLNFVG